ncbi:ShlB/FhaC/HecB family hemolysin secretion/activation protein [Alkalinema pantanalense CENA528]|uniref:ShlB/FhaC/HecB family hemolysin secretion/activation protein n=1 Tax=Alkalinema pantanalense TaxID=1620705 RepID=UPI003D6F0773
MYPVIGFAQTSPPLVTASPNVQIPSSTRDPIEQTLPPALPNIPPTSSPPQPIELPPTPLPNPPLNNLQVKIKVNRIDIVGATIFQSDINQAVQAYQGKEVNFEDLIQLRSRITQIYLDNGYLNSGAFIPNNQDLQSGNIRVQVVEGALEHIEIAGLSRLNERYIRQRLEQATVAPLNKSKLERALQLLQIDPLIEQVNADLSAGSGPGLNILRVVLKEAPAFHVGFNVDNNQSDSVGSLQGSSFISHDNLLGFGDRLSFEYGRTEGLNLYSVGYTLPVNAKDGTFSLRYSKNDSQIIDNTFRELGIRSNSETISATLRQPLFRTPNSEFAIGLGFDLRRSETFLLDNIPFSFSEGPKDGRSKVAVLRLFQDWVNRDAKRVLAARSQFSIGLNAFGATTNPAETPDGQFFTWLGQFQWVQQVSPRFVVVSRIATQISSDSLLSLERFSFGGSDTLRGYRQNQVVSDNGVIGSIEARIPLFAQSNILQLTPFFDWGYGWNHRGEALEPGFLASMGLGIRSQLWVGLDARLDYGIPLVQRSGIADQRWQFSLRYQPF